jgi:hypothetical protein
MNEDYVAGFMAKAAELGVDPEALLGKEAVLGGMFRGIKEMGMTTEDIAKSRQGMVDAYGKKKWLGRLGQSLWDPAQTYRSDTAYGTLKPGLGKELTDADDVRRVSPEALARLRRGVRLAYPSALTTVSTDNGLEYGSA